MNVFKRASLVGRRAGWMAKARWLRWVAATAASFPLGQKKDGLVIGMALFAGCFCGVVCVDRALELPSQWALLDAMARGGEAGTTLYGSMSTMFHVLVPAMIALFSLFGVLALAFGVSLIFSFKKDPALLRKGAMAAEGLACAAWERSEISKETGEGSLEANPRRRRL
jgi:hypothetical protein